MSSSPSVPEPSGSELSAAQLPVLSDTAQFLAAIVHSSEDAIVGENVDGIITSWNRSAETLFGYASEEVLGASGSILHCSEDQPALMKVLDLIRRGQSAPHFETTCIRKNGARLSVSISLSPVYSACGEILGAARIIRETTSAKRPEIMVQDAGKIAAASRLASSIAHEINNPLAALTNLIYLIKGQPLSPPAAHWIVMAERELARISHITTQALGFYRESNSPENHDLALVLDDALALHAHRITSPPLTINKRYAPAPPVRCHGGELRQVFVNLLGNSLDSLKKGGTISLRVRPASCVRSSAPGVRITIADSGCGMSPEIMKCSFDAFFSTKGTTSSGLGLWMCRQIVTRHGGRIRIRSSQSKRHHGTVASVFLPFRPD